jgi:hypothetical protein
MINVQKIISIELNKLYKVYTSRNVFEDDQISDLFD